MMLFPDVAEREPMSHLQHHLRERTAYLTTLAPRVAELVTWDEVRQLIGERRVPAEKVKVRLNRDAVADMMFVRGGDGTSWIDVAMLDQFAARGASIVVNGMHKWSDPVRAFARSMEQQLGVGPVRANCYATFGTDGAFHPHYDDHDVFAIQLAGTKLWRRYNMTEPLKPTRPITAGPLTAENLRGPGDAIFLPAGLVHDAVAQQMPAVHLAFGFSWPPPAATTNTITGS